MTKVIRLITGYLGAIMFVPGFVTFFDPFKIMFSVQSAKSGLPVLKISYWGGQFGELSTGLTMLPMEKKPPFLAVFTLIMVSLNISLHKRTSKSDRDVQIL